MATDAQRFEAPEYVDIDNGSGVVSILTGGLPYHRRTLGRMLDTLLIVRGESARRFRLAIGVNLPQPAAAALELVTPPCQILDLGATPKAASGWLFHVDAKNVVATAWQPVIAEPSTDESSRTPCRTLPRRFAAFAPAARNGRASGSVTLRTFRDVASARQIDFLGQTLLEVHVDRDKIRLDFAAHEWIEVEALWA